MVQHVHSFRSKHMVKILVSGLALTHFNLRGQVLH